MKSFINSLIKLFTGHRENDENNSLDYYVSCHSTIEWIFDGIMKTILISE